MPVARPATRRWWRGGLSRPGGRVGGWCGNVGVRCRRARARRCWPPGGQHRAYPDTAVARVAADYACVELVWMRRQAMVLPAGLPVGVLPAAVLLPCRALYFRVALTSGGVVGSGSGNDSALCRLACCI